MLVGLHLSSIAVIRPQSQVTTHRKNAIVYYMTLLLSIVAISYVVEFILYIQPYPWQSLSSRRIVSGVAVLLISFITVSFVVLHFTIMGLVFASINGHRLLNLLRIAEGRMNEKHLRQVSVRTSSILLGALLLWSVVWFGIGQFSVTASVWLWVIAILQLFVSVVFFASTTRTLNKTKIHSLESYIAESKLPSVTIAIPARNETDELEQCLHSLIKSKYPKLEILVLDDCSQLKRTPSIIRDFAHAGVRFLQGEPPHDSWFAKNHAYAQLAREANGEIILFMGVDIIVEPHTIREIIETMADRNKRMISVIPLRDNPKGIQLSLSQATRYMWELAPPRKFFNRPPVLSSCWAIHKSDLHKYGGFAAVSRMVVPEAYFARQQMLHGDAYSFLRGTPALGLTSLKSLSSQRNTAIRVRYPALHRRPENVLLMSLLEALVIAGSFGFAVIGWFGLVPPSIGIVSSVAAVLFVSSYTLIVVSTRVNSWYIAPFLALPAILFDMILMHVSMWQYEFTDVVWKGRNICLPVMHVVPRLPDIPEG